ncbi:beta-lactamase/transpeptidase-like protein [Cadophora sp. DSE1049]|nr:beta-lactamase/transpeptidase-like protein [Cadophora sp. DSE1049]
MFLLKPFSVLGALLPIAIQAKSNCPLLGPDFPAPKNLSSSQSFQAAIKTITQLVSQAQTGNTSYGPFDVVNTSYSLEFFSIHESAPLFTSHYGAPSLAKAKYGVKTVDSNSVYRIGSVTKLMTVYTALMQCGFNHFNEPINKYIPELQQAAQKLNATSNPLDHPSWEYITLGELASQQSGIGRDYAAFGELGSPLRPLANPAALGLPSLNSSEVALCAGGSFCTREQFFKGFTQRHPVYAPATGAVYSNAAFQLLAYAVENITAKAFSELVEDSLFKPLDLTGSSWTVPKDNSTGVVIDATVWNLDFGDEIPAGGMYSTLSNLTAISRSILASSLLTPAQTRKWMKPLSFTSGPDYAVGAPWEIRRIDTAANNRIIDIYTKTGNLPGYDTLLVLVPSLDIGFNVLTAGVNTPTNVIMLSNLLSDTLIPAAEAAAREEATTTYAGTYASSNTSLNSSITLAIDDSKPGIGVTSWISNGTNMLTPSSFVSGSSVRLYPTGLSRTVEGSTDVEVGFRAVFENLASDGVGGTFTTSCQSWGQVDAVYWGTVGSDEFVVRVGSDSKAKGVSPRALRVELVRNT